MFLMFHLERPDVLAVGDLGIRKSMMVAYELQELPAPATMEEIASRLEPAQNARLPLPVAGAGQRARAWLLR